ncbi:hypothetical protein MTO96_008727 [Rhipicephalus appendiculatus]
MVGAKGRASSTFRQNGGTVVLEAGVDASHGVEGRTWQIPKFLKPFTKVARPALSLLRSTRVSSPSFHSAINGEWNRDREPRQLDAGFFAEATAASLQSPPLRGNASPSNDVAPPSVQRPRRGRLPRTNVSAAVETAFQASTSRELFSLATPPILCRDSRHPRALHS